MLTIKLIMKINNNKVKYNHFLIKFQGITTRIISFLLLKIKTKLDNK